jgi:hypothetical protein
VSSYERPLGVVVIAMAGDSRTPATLA